MSSGDSDLNSTLHLTLSQLESMTKNQLAKQGVRGVRGTVTLTRPCT